MTALNPVMRVGEQVAEAVLAHHKISKREAWERTLDALREVAIAGTAEPRAGLSSPALWRDAAANHDRDGTGI